MAVITATDLLAILRQHQLLEPDQLAELTAKLVPQFPALKDLARELVRRGWLTTYQVNQIGKGHAAELVLGPYVLLDLLGQGGMGAVFKGRHRQLERLAALKVIRKEALSSAIAVQRFEREAKAAAKLDHPHIVRVYDAGEANGVHFLAMEYLEGTDLSKLVRDAGPLAVARACEFIRQAALGLQHAHEQGLVHRDVKPANLMVTQAGPSGTGGADVVKILDLGLARTEGPANQPGAAPADLTQSGSIMGTCDYMAPEQALNTKKADQRSDIYSLGCTLYYLLTGKPMYGGETLMEKMLAHREQPIPPLPNIPQKLQAVYTRLVAKQPEERYQTAGEVAAELAPFAQAASGVASAPRGTTAPAASPEEETVAAGAARPLAASRGRRRMLALSVLSGFVLLAALVGALVAWRSGDRPQSTVASSVASTDKAKPPLPVPEPPALTAANAAEVQRAWAAKLQWPVEAPNKMGLKLILIPPGELVKQPYYLGKYEVTQAQWEKVMGYNPSSFKAGTKTVAGMDTGSFPVEQVSWFDSVEFCNKLSEREGLKPYYELTVKKRSGPSIDDAEVKILGGPGYHIPTDAEWEHACRAGTKTKYHCGDKDEDLPAYAWFNSNSDGRTHAVGEKKPNGFGLVDMHGNVREWNEEMLTNATTRASERVFRGGLWTNPAGSCAVSSRSRTPPAYRHYHIGLRVARVPSGEASK